MKKILSILGTSVLVCLIGCITYLRVSVTRPAEVDLKGFKRIAIGEITGEKGIDFAEELTQALFESGKYEVLDRTHIDGILREHKLSLSGIVDDTTAAQIGKYLGAAALVFGRVAVYKTDEKIADYTSRDGEGKTYTTYTREQWADVSVHFRIIDCTTGKILATRTIDAKPTVKHSATDKEPEKTDPETLLRNGRRTVITQFMKMIAPYTEIVEVPLETDGKMPELALGNSHAKIGNWEEARKIYANAVEKYKNLPEMKIYKAYFNLGIANVYCNDFKSGLEYLNKAYSLNPNSIYLKEIENAKIREKEYKKLLEQRE